MTAEATKTGKELARWAADAYRQMDVRKVEHDVPMAGNQIDVYVELEGHLLDLSSTGAIVVAGDVSEGTQSPVPPGNLPPLSRSVHFQHSSIHVVSQLLVQPTEDSPQALPHEQTE